MDIKSCSEQNVGPAGISKVCGPPAKPKDTVEVNGKSQAIERREIKRREYGLKFNANL